MTDIDLRRLVLGDSFPDELYEFMCTVANKLLRTGGPRSQDDARDLAHATFVRVGFDRFQQAAHGAGNDREYRSWVAKAVRSTRDSSLETDQRSGGRILASIAGALDEAKDRFVRTGRRWCLRGHDHTYEVDDIDMLRQAAAAVDVEEVTQQATADRHAPIASRSDQRALCAAILDAAGGCLDKTDLGRIVADRLGLPFGIKDVEPDAVDQAGIGAPDGLDDYFDEVTVDLILGQLDDAEIELLRDLTIHKMGIREAAEVRGMKKHRMETIRERLKLKLRRLADLHGMPNTAAILTRLDDNSGQSPDLDGSEPTHD